VECVLSDNKTSNPQSKTDFQMSLAEIEHQTNNLSLAELQELKFIVEKKIDTRAKQERSDLIEKMDAMAKERGFGGLEALMGSGGEQSKAKRKPVAPKYRNPSDANDTWSGRGRKPKWVVEMLAAGGSLDDALIRD